MRLGLKGLSLSRPTQEQLDAYADQASRDGPNHLLVGTSQGVESCTESHLTRNTEGWLEDFDAIKVGRGEDAYQRAKAFVKSWQHMSLGWVETNQPLISKGSRVCIAAHMLCFWQKNPLEIVYVTEDERRGPLARMTGRTGATGRTFGYGQTTLQGHALAGEEKFTVRWRADDTVWYEMYAFSRARTILAVIAFPIRRYFQKKFRRDSSKKLFTEIQKSQRGTNQPL